MPLPLKSVAQPEAAGNSLQTQVHNHVDGLQVNACSLIAMPWEAFAADRTSISAVVDLILLETGSVRAARAACHG
jgi:hypothetical protein